MLFLFKNMLNSNQGGENMKKIGKQTVRLSEGVTILSAASTVGPKEAEGPLGKYFDHTTEDMMFGEKIMNTKLYRNVNS